MKDAHDTQPRIAVLDSRVQKWRVLMEDAADGRYVPTGHFPPADRALCLKSPDTEEEIHIVDGTFPPTARNS